MSLVLLAIGLLATAAGLVTIGFGIPINAFSLGNTLILAGSISVATGLILIGMAALLGQLRRIAEALGTRGPAKAAVRLPESVEAPPTARAAPATPVPVVRTSPKEPEPAPVAPEVRLPEPAQPEPRFPATAASEPPPGPLDWLRAKPKAGGAAAPPKAVISTTPEPPMVDVPDEVPLSPRSPQRSSEPTEPKAWSAGRTAPRVEAPAQRAAPQAESKKDDFDLVWPDRGAPGAPPKRDESAKRDDAARREPAGEPAVPPAPPPPSIRPRDGRPLTASKPAERGPAILKSGVIDGMPYTLYADGSIEAELPQGTVKFASVDALRAHLEKQG